MPIVPIWAIAIGISAASTGLQLLLAPRAPKQKPQDVGKYDDIRIQGYDYGAFINRGWGIYRTAGNAIFSNGIQHYVIDSPGSGGGKGGGGGGGGTPPTRTHVYQSSVGVLIGRGEIDEWLRIWADADILLDNQPPLGRGDLEAELQTRGGSASISTAGDYSGTGWVTNLGGGGSGTLTIDASGVPDPPYPTPDPDEIPYPYTALSFFYKCTSTLQASITCDGGTPFIASFPNTNDEWSIYSTDVEGFVDSIVFEGYLGGVAPDLDYIRVERYYLTLTELKAQTVTRKITGVPDPTVLYPPDLNNPTEFYNYDPVNLKDGTTGTYSLTTSVPGQQIRFYTGTETQLQDSAIISWLDSRYGTGQGVLRASAMRGLVWVMFENYTLRNGRLPNFTFELDTGRPDVNDILEDLFADVGIDASDYDISGTAGLTQLGFIETSSTSRSSLIDQLQNYHLFRRAEIDGKIKTIPYSYTSIYTVGINSLRAHSDTEDFPLHDAEVVISEEHLLPREVRLSFMDPDIDYHNNTAPAALFTVAGSESLDINTAVIDTFANARMQSEKNLLKKHSESKAIEIFAMPELAQYAPGDVITVPINGQATKMRVEKMMVMLPHGKIRVQGVTVNPFTPSTFQADTTSTVAPSNALAAVFEFPRNSVVIPIDSEPIRDADVGKYGVYLAACGRGRGASESITLYREFGSENFVLQTTIDTPSQVGVTETAPDDWASTAKDTTSVVDLWFFDDIELESVSTDIIDRYPTANLIRIGDEWIQYETAVAQTLEDNSVYRSKWRITDLWRGRFKTAMTGHAAGEYAVNVTNALRFYPLEPGDVGQSITLKAVTGGQDIDLASETTFVYTNVARPSGSRLLFEHLDTATTTQTSAQILYSDTIDAGTLSIDGDVIESEYCGTFAANGNSKAVILEVAGQEVANISVTENNEAWSIEAEIMRVSNTSLKVSATLSYGTAGNVSVINSTLTGLDLTSTDYDIILSARTPTSVGDLTASFGFGKLWRGTDEVILISEDTLNDLTDEDDGATLIEE
jgi:hypothetical protein